MPPCGRWSLAAIGGGNRRDPPCEATGGPPARVDARSVRRAVRCRSLRGSCLISRCRCRSSSSRRRPPWRTRGSPRHSPSRAWRRLRPTSIPFDADDPAGRSTSSAWRRSRWRAGRGWLAALRIEWNGRRDRRSLMSVERLARTRLESRTRSIRAPPRIGRPRCAGDDVRLAARAWCCRLTGVSGRRRRSTPSSFTSCRTCSRRDRVDRTARPRLPGRQLAQSARLVAQAPAPVATWLKKRAMPMALSTGVEPARYAQILLDFFVVVRRRPRRVIWSTAMARGDARRTPCAACSPMERESSHVAVQTGCRTLLLSRRCCS